MPQTAVCGIFGGDIGKLTHAIYIDYFAVSVSIYMYL